MKAAARGLLVAIFAAVLAACGSPAPRHSTHRAAATVRSAGQGQYTVEKGDTLYSIAFRNQLDYHDLADWNDIGRDYLIRVGQVLRLTPPRGVALAAPASAPTRAAEPAPAASPPTTAIRLPAAVPFGGAFDARRFEWPTRGRVIRQFDADAGAKGVDIGGDLGQVVVAAAPGKVVYSGSALKGYGELIIIKHDEEFLSAYGYNRRRLVKEAEFVAAGQPIAELGVGPEQKPLLHFEIRDRGRPVNPLPLLPAR